MALRPTLLLRGRLNRRRLQPLHVCDEFSDSPVALVEVIDGALVDDAPHLVGGRREGLPALEDVGQDVVSAYDLTCRLGYDLTCRSRRV